jgi:hypothetical protein
MHSPSATAGPGRLRRWWLDRSVRVKGMIVVAVPLIALVGVTSAILVLQYKERPVRSVAVTAFRLGTAAQQVMVDAVNAETGVRGYAVTRDPLFLQPYNAIVAQVPADRAARDGQRGRRASGADGALVSEKPLDLSELVHLLDTATAGHDRQTGLASRPGSAP